MPYTKLIIKYQRDDYCCCAWLYATSVKIANKPQSIESNYENGNIIYIVMNNSNNEAVHFTDRYEASCYMDRYYDHYMLECTINDIYQTGDYYLDGDMIEMTTDMDVSVGDIIYVCQYKDKKEFHISHNKDDFADKKIYTSASIRRIRIE